MNTEEQDLISSALFGQSTPDLGPLVTLLRSNRPLPAGVRDMLACMIDPENDGYLYLRFKLENTEGKIRNTERDVQNQAIAAAHHRLVSSGLSANEAATTVGEKYGLDQRSVYRRLNEAKAARDWTRGSADKNR